MQSSSMLDDMSSSTPSPTACVTPSTNNSSSRRPPRKSTLTQQQKNQKRQRATQDQLSLLEVEFGKNPTPTAAVRERIAQEINMTERSVQIWFQNRRAKIKSLAKKSIETGEDCDAIPESYRTYLQLQALETGRPLMRNLTQTGGTASYNTGSLNLGGDNPMNQKVVIHHFSCRALSIGSWRRVGQNAMDLVIFYSVGEKPCLTYYINNESAGYKIEFPFAYIKNITLDNGIGEDGTIRPAGLMVELNRPPNFYMDSAGSNGFYQCGDFTEDQQASRVLTHHLGGDPLQLSDQLAKLVVLDSFQNRLNPYIDTSAVAASAPVSPVGHRPSSQPMVTPQLNIFQDHGFGGMSLHPHARGHKRTRSRSVPAMVDFGMLRQPTPSFHVQHPSTSMTDHSIWAPAPQHNHLTPHAHDLRINTAAGYELDYRQYPMSAATTTSPSEFASPGFFASTGAHMDQMPPSSYNGGYSLPYLSPMPEHPHLLQQSMSPLSPMTLHGDPVIADHSPPLLNLPRSQSADFLTMSQDHSSSMDEGLMLSEMYAKQSINLPIRPSAMDDANLDMHLSDEPSQDEMDMHAMLQFVDPSNLGPGNIGM